MTSQCNGCQTMPRLDKVHTIDEKVSQALRFLDDASEQFQGQLATYITKGARGIGPLRDAVSSRGTGEGAVLKAESGDIIIARGLFPDSEPRIEIVGFSPDHSPQVMVESLQSQERVEVYRTVASESFNEFVSDNFEDNFGALLGRGIRLLGATSKGGGNSAQSTIKSIDDGLDLGLKVIKLVREGIKRDGLPEVKSTPLELQSTLKPLSPAKVRDTAWTFKLVARTSKGSNADALYLPFGIKITHDCFNIKRALVYPLESSAAGFWRNERKLQMTIEPSLSLESQIPPEARFNINGVWIPDLWFGGDKKHSFDFDITVGADGSVKISNILSPWLSTTSLTRHSGPAVASCTAQYNKLKQGQNRPDTPPISCLLYTSPSPRDRQKSRMPSSA